MVYWYLISINLIGEISTKCAVYLNFLFFLKKNMLIDSYCFFIDSNFTCNFLRNLLHSNYVFDLQCDFHKSIDTNLLQH